MDDSIILQCAIGFPSRIKFKCIVKGNQLRNFPITVSDLDRDDAIYGPQVAIFKVNPPENVQGT